MDEVKPSEKLIREYRPSMDADVLHSWAGDAVETLRRLAALNQLIEKMQGHMVAYLSSQNVSAEEFIHEIIYLLDGPEQREAQASLSPPPGAEERVIAAIMACDPGDNRAQAVLYARAAIAAMGRGE